MGIGIGNYIPIIAYSCSILILLLTLLYKIEFGIYFTVFMLPLQNLINKMQVYPMGKDVIDIFILAILLKWFFGNREDKSSKFIRTPLNWPIILFLIWSYLELWLGSFNLGLPNPTQFSDHRFQYWVRILRIFILYFIVLNNLKRPKQIKILIFVVLSSTLLVSYWFVGQTAVARSAQSFDWEFKEAAATFSYLNSNNVGTFYAQYSIIFLTMALLDKNIWLRLLLGYISLMGYFSVVFTFSRAGYLAALVGLAFLGLVKKRIVGIALLIFILFWQSFVPQSVVTRVEMTKNEEGELDSSTQARFNYWSQAEEIISANFLWGKGFRTAYLIGFDSDQGLGKGGRARSVHNEYFTILMELGVIGFMLYLWLLLSAIRAGWKLYRIAEERFYKGLGLGFVAGVLAHLISSISGVNWYHITIMGFFWVLLALITRITINLEQVQPESIQLAETPRINSIHKFRRHVSKCRRFNKQESYR